jgi:peptidoglycan/LPS O-acetylase OafA/YrhL
MISYSLYLIHLPLGKKVIPLLARYIEGDGLRLLVLVLLFGFTLLLAYGFYLLIERPAMRWSKYFKYGKRN